MKKPPRITTPPPDSQSSSVAVNIYVKSWLVYSTRLTSILELGRQRLDEALPYTRVADRVIVAKLEESSISRQHVLLEMLADNRVRITNKSSINTIIVGTSDEIQPGDHRDVAAPTLLTLFDRVIQLNPQQDERAAESGLESLAHMTTPPGSHSSGASSIVELLENRRSDDDTEQLLWGLHATLDVFQRAATSSDFLSLAVQAMIDVLRLETAAALMWTGRDWNVEVVRINSEKHPRGPIHWEPSRTILHQVRDEKRTFWRVPQYDMESALSLFDVKALVAAPILNGRGDVIGALYGDRRHHAAGADSPQISEIEAILVELFSTSVAAGLARLEQEQETLKAKVLFEQFFTAELSRQLEVEPDLLLGKDAEVTLLFCDIRGFSQVSEQLGARLTLDWINDVMGTLSNCIAGHRGVLVDTMGDELIGMWGAPVERSDHASLACRAAIEMLQLLPALNRRWQKVLQQPIDLGIGIHTGTARVGNIGSETKFKYGPLGYTVKKAKQTQQATQPFQVNVLISGPTAAHLDDDLSVRRLCRVTYQQQEEPIDLYELAARVSEGWPELKRRYESALEAYERGDIPTATRLLAKILVDHPGDSPSLQLLSRIHGKLPPSDWSL